VLDVAPALEDEGLQPLLAQLLGGQPPEMPEPMTIASKVVASELTCRSAAASTRAERKMLGRAP